MNKVYLVWKVCEEYRDLLGVCRSYEGAKKLKEEKWPKTTISRAAWEELSDRWNNEEYDYIKWSDFLERELVGHSEEDIDAASDAYDVQEFEDITIEEIELHD